MDPVHIIGGIYYIGSTTVSSFVINTGEGLVLVDAGTPMMFDAIKHNIESLGFQLSDIKYIISSHAHWDHVGGLANMQKQTAAKVVALGLDAESIASGKDTSAVSFLGLNWDPVPIDRVIKDRDSFTLGDVTIHAYDTPGHTKGCTTWTTTIREGEKDYKVAFLGGTSVNAGVKLLNNPLYPNIAEDYKKTFAVLASLSPDVYLAQHPFFFNLSGKLEQRKANPAVNPFVDPDEWTMFIQNDELKFLRQLDDEWRALSASKAVSK
nr:subclass B3 metallo-beta-lactamase [Zhongshania aquimaris]